MDRGGRAATPRRGQRKFAKTLVVAGNYPAACITRRTCTACQLAALPGVGNTAAGQLAGDAYAPAPG